MEWKLGAAVFFFWWRSRKCILNIPVPTHSPCLKLFRALLAQFKMPGTQNRKSCLTWLYTVEGWPDSPKGDYADFFFFFLLVCNKILIQSQSRYSYWFWLSFGFWGFLVLLYLHTSILDCVRSLLEISSNCGYQELVGLNCTFWIIYLSSYNRK